MCEDCGKSFTSIPKLNTHKLAEHREACTKCHEKFNTKDLLAMHMVDHLFKCDYCHEAFETDAELQNHLEAVHQINCQKCTKVFYKKEDIEKHEKDEHHHPCHKCSFVMDSKKDLEDHIKILHTFPCGYCAHTADEVGKLSEHEDSEHGHCGECEDEFTWVDPGHKCYFTDKKITPNFGRVIVQNMYFEKFTHYFI